MESPNHLCRRSSIVNCSAIHRSVRLVHMKDCLLNPVNPLNFAKIELNLGGDLSVAPATYSRFIQFLTDDMAVSTSSIDFALRHRENACDPLPMILWQYGLISLEQLDRIFAWLETA